MKITSLLENTTQRNDIKIEHGLSLYIETEAQKILFDMGQTELFSENAKVLGIDLSSVDLAVLSHGHYDHGGGLRKFLEINKRAPVYIHRDAFSPHYNGEEKYIGLDTALANDPRIVFTDDEFSISPSLFLTTCNKAPKAHPSPRSGLTEKTENGYIPDDFRHEQYLMIKERSKRILISGCSHKGILNISEWLSPDALIGGFHYSKLPLDEYLVSAAKILSSSGADFYTCHCTGKEQYEFMRRYMPSLKYLSCGQQIII